MISALKEFILMPYTFTKEFLGKSVRCRDLRSLKEFMFWRGMESASAEHSSRQSCTCRLCYTQGTRDSAGHNTASSFSNHEKLHT
jgi:hypothetical protein